MTPQFTISDHVTWQSEAGPVNGKIIKIHTRDTTFKGNLRRASPEAPQYEIQSDRTDLIAMHEGAALTKL
ncbi:DUF2945 domain-containing protein [Simplicispira psychrophila]|uniref:DUF2945 domain-containing protein n=1 Tax=Simplicispira psychrophila TaxID=80882 RepID=UPI000480A93C|nr:DUF2945 domain-containing protein [Simplicispira psychrophila]